MNKYVDLLKWPLQACLLTILAINTVYAEIEPMEEENAAPPGPSLETATGTNTPAENTGFVHGFIASISVILVSEIGDKTFFIAAIMAMRHPRLTVFAGAIFALALMTFLSALFGWLINVVPRAYTFYISTALLAIFGLKMLKEGYNMSSTEGQEEMEEVQLDLRKKEEEYEKENLDPEAGGANKRTAKQSILSAVSRVFLQAFTLTFLAEWGDRSQLTTIVLGAREDVYGVIIGGIAGHSVCTGAAVLGGRMIAQRISVRTVTIIGGIVFLIFAFSSLFFDPEAV
ncbi:putative divalent cation/proton antiporter TMEM165 [Onthophagus taurus]|uniref:putative divalent cation/proton antiporter TMEM165 n=1 Tax=Onthophagus taurus TaxID=166361 RepID=UPI000C207BCC|nr:transmembrane protein 165 [Onthophagus taurus]